MKKFLSFLFLPILTFSLKRLFYFKKSKEEFQYYSDEIKTYYDEIIKNLELKIDLTSFRQNEINSNLPISDYIDHTLLKSNATSEEISNLCNEAIKYNFKAVLLKLIIGLCKF
jgi:hypothetical protein